MTRLGADGLVKAPPTDDSHNGIAELWPVPVWLGHVGGAPFEPSSSWDLSDEGSARELPFVRQVQEAALTACTRGLDDQWSWRYSISRWPSGFFIGATHSEGDIRAVVILKSNASEEHSDSGAISIHDPRDGAGNVALPGLPWGRPFKIPGRVGMAFAIPGWLRWSVAPLRPPHAMTVWTATASRVPASEGR